MFQEPPNDRSHYLRKVEIRPSSIEGAGLGVYATEKIGKYEVFERSHIIPFHSVTLKHLYSIHGMPHILNDYTFQWKPGTVCIVLGYGSIYNHSDEPNASYRSLEEPECMEFYAIGPIEPGEEIRIKYIRGPGNKELTFSETGSFSEEIGDPDDMHRTGWQMNNPGLKPA